MSKPSVAQCRAKKGQQSRRKRDNTAGSSSSPRRVVLQQDDESGTPLVQGRSLHELRLVVQPPCPIIDHGGQLTPVRRFGKEDRCNQGFLFRGIQEGLNTLQTFSCHGAVTAHHTATTASESPPLPKGIFVLKLVSLVVHLSGFLPCISKG